MNDFKNNGSKVGITVGIIPNLKSPPTKPFCCSTISLILLLSSTIIFACSTIFSPTSVS